MKIHQQVVAATAIAPGTRQRLFGRYVIVAMLVAEERVTRMHSRLQ